MPIPSGIFWRCKIDEILTYSFYPWFVWYCLFGFQNFASVCEARLRLCVEDESLKAELIVCLAGAYFQKGYMTFVARVISLLCSLLLILRMGLIVSFSDFASFSRLNRQFWQILCQIPKKNVCFYNSFLSLHYLIALQQMWKQQISCNSSVAFCVYQQKSRHFSRHTR